MPQYLDPADFWTGTPAHTPAGPPTPPDALLDQVPSFPIAVRTRTLPDVLRPLYRALGTIDG